MIKDSFNLSATSYNQYNIIQKQVAKELLAYLDFEPKKILELGAGTGEICKNIGCSYEHYIAVDSAQNMLALHPQNERIQLCCSDFDNAELYENQYDLIISSSSLQWSKDIDSLFANIQKSSRRFLLSIFTANTFRNIHDFLGVKSTIYDAETIENLAKKYLDCEIVTKNYRLEFDNTRQIFTYLKKSGVNRENILTYKEAKKLYSEFEEKHLEFEVVFCIK